MELDALKVIELVEDLKHELKLTDINLSMIEENSLLRFDVAKLITNFAIENNLQTIEEIKRSNSVLCLCERLRLIFIGYQNLSTIQK